MNCTEHKPDIHGPAVSLPFPSSISNGKEKDHESGFHYYGARYYWSELLTGWLSVDPMMDKYPNVSPYAYCVWNPIHLIDPDGMDTTVGINLETGNVDYNANPDSYNGSTVEIYNGNQQVCAFKLSGEISLSFHEKATDVTFSDYNDASQVYSILIGNNPASVESSVEWNYYRQKDESGGLVTSQKPDVINLTGLDAKYNKKNTSSWRHFHPKLSGYAWYVPSVMDQKYAVDVMGGIPCYLDFNGQSYRFDNIVKKNGIVNVNKFKVPLNINRY